MITQRHAFYIKEIKDGDRTRYFVGIQGDVGEFMKMSSTSHDLANLVENKNVVEFGLTSQDLSRYGGAVTLEPGERGNANTRVLVNPQEMDIATDSLLSAPRWAGQNQQHSWLVRPFNTSIATWREFGYIR